MEKDALVRKVQMRIAIYTAMPFSRESDAYRRLMRMGYALNRMRIKADRDGGMSAYSLYNSLHHAVVCSYMGWALSQKGKGDSNKAAAKMWLNRANQILLT